jgi:hypothetical protein
MMITLILDGLEGNSTDQELTEVFMHAAARGEKVMISGQSFQVVDSLALAGTNVDSQFSFILQRAKADDQ